MCFLGTSIRGVSSCLPAHPDIHLLSIYIAPHPGRQTKNRRLISFGRVMLHQIGRKRRWCQQKSRGIEECWCWLIGYFQANGITDVDRLGAFRITALSVLAIRVDSEKNIAGVGNPGTFRKSTLLFSIFEPNCPRKNQWILHRTAGFRKSALSACNVDFLFQPILCKKSGKPAM